MIVVEGGRRGVLEGNKVMMVSAGKQGGDGGGGDGKKEGEYAWIPPILMMREGPGSTSVT